MTPELLLFTTNPAFARECLAAGIDAPMVDWETKGKHERQFRRDTEINSDGPADIQRLRNVPSARVACRINAFGPWTPDEVEIAVASGATDLFLPMVSRVAEVDRFLGMIGGRARAGILIETLPACLQAPALARFQLDAVYLGLNDLAIDRGSSSIFAPLCDGLALQVRQHFAQTRFGVGGLTLVDRGHPIPCRLLMAELQRLHCDFTFLRRSFKRDIAGRDIPQEIRRIRQCWTQLVARRPLDVERDHREFCACVAACKSLRPEFPAVQKRDSA